MSLSMVLTGLLVGLLVGMTGVGAASLLTPLLVMIGVEPILAIGTDLAYNGVTKFFGTLQHWRQKTVNWTLVVNLAIASVPAAAVGAFFVHLLGLHGLDVNNLLKHSLGGVLILAALASLFRAIFGKKWRPNKWQERPLSEKRLVTAGIGLVVGFLVGLTSIGSGSLFAIAFLFLYKLGPAELVGTDIAHAFLLTAVAATVNAAYGNVNYGLAGHLLIGAVPGVVVGSMLATKVPAKPLRMVLSLLILFSGLKMV